MAAGTSPQALAYLQQCQTGLLRVTGRVTLSAPADEDGEQALARQHRWAQYLRATLGEDPGPQLVQHAWNLEHWLTQFERQLLDDLSDHCLSAQDQQALRMSALAYLPLVEANACASPVPHAPGQHFIAVELGLIWISFLLAEALLLAAEGWDEAAHDTYRIVLEGSRTSALRPAFSLWFVGSPLSRDEHISMQAGAVGTVILRFIALHELGHIVLGHVAEAGMTCTPQTGQVSYQHAPELGQAATWAMEEAADDFALAHMLARTGSAQQMWNNMLFIGLMFRFWDHLWRRAHPETTPWSADCTHPPPLARLERLTQQVQAALGPPPNDAPRWAELTFAQWCQPWPATAQVQAPSNQ